MPLFRTACSDMTHTSLLKFRPENCSSEADKQCEARGMSSDCPQITRPVHAQHPAATSERVPRIESGNRVHRSEKSQPRHGAASKQPWARAVNPRAAPGAVFLGTTPAAAPRPIEARTPSHIAHFAAPFASATTAKVRFAQSRTESEVVEHDRGDHLHNLQGYIQCLVSTRQLRWLFRPSCQRLILLVDNLKLWGKFCLAVDVQCIKATESMHHYSATKMIRPKDLVPQT